MTETTASRRFSSVSRVYGSAGLERLARAHAVVVGIGGVGSWAAEALARSGVGRLTLIDLDHVAESNINRQVHALQSTLGAAKIEVMAARIREISPDCVVNTVDAFIEPGEEDALIPADADLVIDAIDAVAAKASMIAWCVARKLPIIVCGAAGGRTDPLQLRSDDLARTQGDALLSAVRARLRRHHGFARGAGVVPQKMAVSPAVQTQSVSASLGLSTDTDAATASAPSQEAPASTASAPAASVSATIVAAQSKAARGKRAPGKQPVRFGVEAIFSPEQIAGQRPQAEGGGMPLACAGYGSLVTVTAAMGLAAASRALTKLLAIDTGDRDLARRPLE